MRAEVIGVDVIVAVVGPLLTAVLAGLGVLLKEWRIRRRWEHRRDEIIDQGRKQVAFISDWAAAYRNLAVPIEDRTSQLTRARQDLDALYRAVAAQIDEAVQQRPQRRPREFYIAWILLKGVRRPWARVSRVLYFGALLTALLGGVGATVVGVVDDDFTLIEQVAFAIFVTLFYLVPTALLHILTRHLDRPRRPPEP